MLTEEQIERRRSRDREYKRRKRAEQPEKTRQEAAAWRAANRDKIAEYNRRQWERTKQQPELLERERARNRVENMSPEAVEAQRQRGRIYSKAKTEEAHQRGTTRYQIELTPTTRERNRRKMRQWRAANRERARELHREATQRYRDKRGPRAAIDTYAYKAVRMALVAQDAKSKYFPDFTGKDLKRRMMALMPNGWTFADYGDKWEIDHIDPITAFDYDSIDDPQYRRCWSLHNLRPLCKVANRKKGGSKRSR